MEQKKKIFRPRVVLDIPLPEGVEIWKEVRKAAIDKNITVSEFVFQAIRNQLAAEAKKK